VVDELHQLAELHERGHISIAEYHEAKKQLLAAGPRRDRDSTPDGALLLYQLISAWLKRAAAAMVVVALMLGVVASWSGCATWTSTPRLRRSQTQQLPRGSALGSPIPARRSIARSWRPRPPPTAVSPR
jgi:uncharacterized protein YciI